MNIQSILAKKGSQVITIGARQSIREALETLVQYNIGALVVVNQAEQPIGILSERDIVRAAATGKDWLHLDVRTLMTRELITGVPDDDLEVVAHTMTEQRIRHVPVVDQGRRLIGIVSIGDIVKAQRDQYEGELYTLQTQLLADTA